LLDFSSQVLMNQTVAGRFQLQRGSSPVASENLDSCVSMVQSAEDRMRNNASLRQVAAGRLESRARFG
jgi:hypothetical protein